MVAILTCDTSKVEKMLGNMLFQLKAFPSKMKDEMLAWQADDMNRKSPRAKYSLHRRRVSTKIYPRGRHHYEKKTRNYPAHRRRGHRRHWSTRPILRPVLYDEFRARMTKLFGEIGWA
jgi:hypothetical protein